MKSYLPIGNDEYVEIHWNELITEKRAYTHISCKREGRGRKIGEIVYRAASFCLGPKELAGDEKNALCIRDYSSHSKKGERSYDVRLYGCFSALFKVEQERVTVSYHPDADVELLIDDVFQMALSEVVRGRDGWVFHGGGVSFGDQGLLLVGRSCSGKSTACLSLLLDGFSLLGDDASLVVERDGGYWAVPVAEEVSVRLPALALFQAPHQIVLHPVGERLFWREAFLPAGAVPLKVISFLEIEGGEKTWIEEVTPQVFYLFFQHKAPLHGFDKGSFKDCVEALSQGGVRFVRGRLGVSPRATVEAYLKCLEDPKRGYWQGQGSRRIMTVDEGSKLVGRCWTEPKTTSLNEIIPLIAHPSEGLSRSAQMVLAEEPLSCLEPLPWEDYDELWASDGESKEEINWCRLEEWKDGSRGLLERADWRFVEQNVEQWLRLAPILYPLLRHYSQDNPQLRPLIDEGWRKYLAWKYPPQVMLYLTDRCQLRCPYCYALEKLKGGCREMAWKELEWLLDWSLREGFTAISLTGGEPTLYPWFAKLVETLEQRGFGFYFATNLLFPRSLWRYVEETASLEIHLCDPKDYSSVHLELLEQNLKWLRGQRFPKVFRYNLWRRELSDWKWVLDIVKEFKDVNFAFAVPFPSPTRQNLFLDRRQLEKFAKVVVEFVRYCEKEGLRATCVKPYPLCAFSGEEALYLLRRGSLRTTCEIGASGCTRNLVVDPELRVLPCIALDLSPGSIAAFPSRRHLETRLKTMVSELFKCTNYERCCSCELRNWKLCMGGCLAYYTSPELINITA